MSAAIDFTYSYAFPSNVQQSAKGIGRNSGDIWRTNFTIYP